MRLIKVFLLFSFLIGMCSLKAQPKLTRNYAYRYFTTRDGLAQMQVLCAFQDKDGYMWFGTKGGVSRYDGIRFKNYTQDNGLPSGDVRTIGEIGHKKVFFFQRKMAILNEDESIDVVGYPDSLVIDNYKRLTLELSNTKAIIFNLHYIYGPQNIWKKKTHFIYDTRLKKFQRIVGFHKRIIDFNSEFLLAEDGIYQRVGLKLKRLLTSTNRFDGAEANWQKGEFYMRDMNTQHVEKYMLENGRIKFDGTALTKAYHPQITLLPDQSLLYYDIDFHPHFVPERSIGLGVNFTIVEKTFVDREGNLWIMTNNGLYNFFNLTLQEYKFNICDPDNVWNILEDNDGGMWFGSYFGGLWRLDVKGQLLPMNKAFFDWGRQYMGGTKAKNGTLYFPSGDGIQLYQNKKFSHSGHTGCCLSTYYDNERKQIYYSGNDTINNLGLNVGLGKEHRFYPWKRGFPISIAKDSKGRIRLGAFRGVGFFDGEKIITDTTKRAYTGVISMALDGKGRLWKGTMNGVYVELPNDKEYRVAPRIKGMISSVWVWHNKYLLLGTISGIGIVHIADDLRNPEVWEIGYDGGFTGLESGQNGFFEDHNGDMWMTTALSVMKFNPEKLVQSQKQVMPTIRVLSLFYSKDNVTWSQSFFDKGNIVIDPANKFLRIEYIANSISAPKSLRFKYRLKGFSDNWSNELPSKSADFTNLDYGKYQFEVKCSLDGEVWTSIATTSEFEIATPLALKWYFVAFYILIAILFVVAVTRLIVRRNQRKKLELITHQKLENELQLKTLQSKIIPHFTKNVLSAIGYLAMSDRLKISHYIAVFSRFTSLTLENADKNYNNLKSEIVYIENYLDLEKLRFEDRFQYSINVNPNIDTEIFIPSMALHTYCDNAIRHGLVNKQGIGKLTVAVDYVARGILITVTDDGVGRVKAASLGTRGNGQGLSLIEAQIEFYNKSNSEPIIQDITDLYDSFGNPIGTQIELYIPTLYRFE